MDILLLILAIAVVAVGIICAFKESKTTGLYSTFGVYGRFTAYLALLPIPALIAIITGIAEGEWVSIIVGVIMGAIGVFIWIGAYSTCPEFLKKKLPISLFISAFGCAFKLALFFVYAIWKLESPREMQDEDGNPIYVSGNNVYNKNGDLVGKLTSDGNSYIKID